MKKIFLVSILAVSAALSFAQESKPMGVSARLGFFLPTAEAARKAGKQWLTFGFDYKLGDLKYEAASGKAASYGVSVDYASKGDFTQVPVVLMYTSTLEGGFYYLGGAGLNFTKSISKGTNPKKESKTGFAYQVGIGMEIKGQKLPAFAEIKYMGSSRSNLNGLGIFGGVRF
jgi:hypothetical protein